MNCGFLEGCVLDAINCAQKLVAGSSRNVQQQNTQVETFLIVKSNDIHAGNDPFTSALTLAPLATIENVVVRDLSVKELTGFCVVKIKLKPSCELCVATCCLI